MTISTCIQGSIVSELSGTIYGDPIENNDDLLNSNLPIKTISGVAFLFRIGFHERDGEIYKRIQALEGAPYPFQAGNMAVEKKDFATIVDTGYIIMRPNILRSFSVFEVYGMKQNLAMPKNSYFTEQYNEWIGHLMEIGVLSKFIKLYQYFYALKFYVEEDKRSFVVTLEQLLPVLSIVGAGYFLALLIFVMELAVDRWQTIEFKPARKSRKISI
ncbi:uncharacterized protein LOC125504885 [Dendroctonus ponderosae]|uniref:uncharacterized protein LOC125504885 n=1 Tax=Dendroctonus ponderosae TaxID=77166 RepID=UPI0020358432|nr:uncharacterized protein LOC125504885 [Dendroctonus ponderosae]